jgi:hypothetical protein
MFVFFVNNVFSNKLNLKEASHSIIKCQQYLSVL